MKSSFKSKVKEVKKEKAADRGIIPIPNMSDDDVDVSDQDMDVLAEFGGAATFLKGLDKKGIMRYAIYHFLVCVEAKKVINH